MQMSHVLEYLHLCTGQRRELSRVDPTCGRLHHQVTQLLAVGICQHLLLDGPLVTLGL